jgi:hypothetical protein
MRRVAFVLVLFLFAITAATAGETPRLGGKIEGYRYTHPSGAFRVKITSQLIADGPPGVYFTYVMGPGSMVGRDLVRFVDPKLSAGKAMPEVLTAWVESINEESYRRKRTKASVLSSNEETVLTRKALYAKVALPQFPGTGITVFGARGRQIDADFVDHLDLISIGDLGIARDGKPIEYLCVESIQTDALGEFGGDSVERHTRFLNGVEILKP